MIIFEASNCPATCCDDPWIVLPTSASGRPRLALFLQRFCRLEQRSSNSYCIGQPWTIEAEAQVVGSPPGGSNQSVERAIQHPHAGNFEFKVACELWERIRGLPPLWAQIVSIHGRRSHAQTECPGHEARTFNPDVRKLNLASLECPVAIDGDLKLRPARAKCYQRGPGLGGSRAQHGSATAAN